MPFFRTREVVLPRFKLEQNYDLIENLKEMGLTDLFQESGDFSGMTSEKVAMNWVSKINSTMILKEKKSEQKYVGHSIPCTPYKRIQ